VNCTGFVHIISWYRSIFHHFDHSGFAGFLVVFDAVPNPEVKATHRHRLELQEELGLEDAVDERIGLLWRADTQSKPIVPESRSADVPHRSNRDGPFRRNDKGVVDNTLHHDVDSLGRQNQNARHWLRRAAKLGDKEVTASREDTPLLRSKVDRVTEKSPSAPRHIKTKVISHKTP
jgi:hypothetical protein